ncbi:Hypothetical Protein FCC1311_117812 [Hondaea fermentalgiana]|uniref:Uncharacterized protein n=1 Tax=Hondaea fermentalgiana TaxID=2315210 RepID=A0A2R5FDE5_9STRA|nr:Hypothetical Protein FCC1311_117812 [Hondaea fermentalgiana]|eukprot:GBG16306.1 Hypothetical Protein FCC1311_117812 [Hondaea fermentalgiana]
MYLNKGKKAKGGGKKDKRPKVNLKDYEDPPLSFTSREHVSKILRNSGHTTKARSDKAKTKKLGASAPFTLAMKRLNEVTGPKASTSTSSSSRDGMTHHQVVVRTDPEEEALVAKQLAEEAETEREFLAKVNNLMSGSASKPLANTVTEERVHQPSASNPFRYPLTFGAIMVKNVGLINPDDSDFKKNNWNTVFVNQCLEEYTAEVLCVHQEKQIVRAEDLKEYWRLLAKGRLLKGLFKKILADSLFEAYKAAIESKEITRRSAWVESVLNHGKRSQFGSLFDFDDLGPAPLGGKDAKNASTSGNAAASGKTPGKKKLLLSVSSSDDDRDDDPLDFEDDQPAKSSDGGKGKLADNAPGTPLKKRKVTTPVHVYALDEEEDDFEDDAKLLAQRKAAFAAAQKELRALEMRVERRKAAEKAEREAAAKAAREAVEKAAREAEKKAKREAEMKAKREEEEKAAREAEMKAKREEEEKAKVEAEKKFESEASGVVAQPVLVESADSEEDEIGRVLQLHSQLGKAIHELVKHLEDSGKA